MFVTKRNSKISAARITASLFGVLAGIGGMIHGPGEILQGNIAPNGIAFNSWIREPIATNVGGEPAMSIIPNLFISGILTILIALILIVCATAYVHKKNGGVLIIVLSLMMLLVGGGFAPPIIGIISGIAGLGINAATPNWCKNLPSNFRNYLAIAWPWIFTISATDGIILFIGVIIFAYIIGLNIPSVWVSCFLLLIPLLILTIITGVAFDDKQTNVT